MVCFSPTKFRVKRNKCIIIAFLQVRNRVWNCTTNTTPWLSTGMPHHLQSLPPHTAWVWTCDINIVSALETAVVVLLWVLKDMLVRWIDQSKLIGVSVNVACLGVNPAIGWRPIKGVSCPLTAGVGSSRPSVDKAGAKFYSTCVLTVLILLGNSTYPPTRSICACFSPHMTFTEYQHIL